MCSQLAHIVGLQSVQRFPCRRELNSQTTASVTVLVHGLPSMFHFESIS